jgi:superfamily II DNA/RNA helicase
LSKEWVTLLLSATMPKDIEILSNQYMKGPLYVEIEEQNSAVDRISQERYTVIKKTPIKGRLRKVSKAEPKTDHKLPACEIEPEEW